MAETTRDEIIGEALKQGASWEDLVATGPGKLEGNGDRPLAAAIEHLAFDPDQQTGAADSPVGHVARVDRWLSLTDEQGFVSVIEYTTVANAVIAFHSYDREYAEWDAQVEDDLSDADK